MLTQVGSENIPFCALLIILPTLPYLSGVKPSPDLFFPHIFKNIHSKADINGNIQPVKGMDARKRIDGFMALLDAYKVLLDKRDEYVNLNEGD